MAETPWTPGPWRVATREREEDAWAEIDASNAGWQQLAKVVTIFSNRSDNELSRQGRANSSLIAAAPDLYAALAAIEQSTDYGMDDDRPLMRAARAALTKARGETDV